MSETKTDHTAKNIEMPFCPLCKTQMTVSKYEGYYESFDYWECECKDLPKPTHEWRGQYA